MHAQHIVEFVYKFLWEQGRSSVNGAACAYKNVYGEKCAVGCLIDPIDYDPAMEGRPLVSLLKLFPELPDWFKKHQDLLTALQYLHDSAALAGIQDSQIKYRKELFAAFDIFCEKHNYDATFLDQYRK